MMGRTGLSVTGRLLKLKPLNRSRARPGNP